MAGTIVTTCALFFLKRPLTEVTQPALAARIQQETIIMIKLLPQHIRLGVRAKKEEAIRAAGQALVDAGHIAPGYVESMLGREGQANAYLSSIAIPHGMQKAAS